MVVYTTMVQAAWRATYRVTVRWSKRQNPAIAVDARATSCVAYLPSDLLSAFDLFACPAGKFSDRKSRDCPESQNTSGSFGGGGGGGGGGSGSGGQECYRCGKVGHIARACPEAPGGGSGGYGGGGGGGYGSFGGGGSQKTWCALVLSCRLARGS